MFFIGWEQGGTQSISCDVLNGWVRGNIIHEIGHAVGMWHEHQREDRDDNSLSPAIGDVSNVTFEYTDTYDTFDYIASVYGKKTRMLNYEVEIIITSRQ